ncbi:hypothetical protein JCM10213_001017 [Rhodosporidiobolus nylandii]
MADNSRRYRDRDDYRDRSDPRSRRRSRSRSPEDEEEEERRLQREREEREREARAAMAPPPPPRRRRGTVTSRDDGTAMSHDPAASTDHAIPFAQFGSHQSPFGQPEPFHDPFAQDREAQKEEARNPFGRTKRSEREASPTSGSMRHAHDMFSGFSLSSDDKNTEPKKDESTQRSLAHSARRAFSGEGGYRRGLIYGRL